jgi:class 3 adenylate cyclase
MTVESKHLERIMTNYDASAYLHVVFVDVERYSLRSRVIQKEVIQGFAACLDRAFAETSQEYIEYTQRNKEIDFQTDVIKLPTGDGAAIVFPFSGLHNIHLFFAKRLHKEIYEHNIKTPACRAYDRHGWCDCHDKFGVRVGISEGNGLIYKDINGNYNVAGEVINMASRVMDIADKGQIIFTEETYKEFVQVYPHLKSLFAKLENVKIKRGFKTVYQYMGEESEPYISPDRPKEITDFGFPTQFDVKNALAPFEAKLEHLRRLLEHPLGGRALEGKEMIYGAVVEAMKKAERSIKVVRLGIRPAVEIDVLKELSDRVLNENHPVGYDIVVVLNPKEPLGGFIQNHEDLLQLLIGGHEGKHPRYNPYVLETDKPICFDTIIVDDSHIGIGFHHARGVEDLQKAIMFGNNPYMAKNFADWFVTQIMDQAVPFDVWFANWKNKMS